jgi:hypothetical protein
MWPYGPCNAYSPVSMQVAHDSHISSTNHSIATAPLGELHGISKDVNWSPAQLRGAIVQETGRKLEFAKFRVASQVEF